MAPQRQVVIGLGSNIEPRLDTLRVAVARLRLLSETRLISVSPVYETEPWGVSDQARFLNAAALVETALAPLGLLDALLAIERDLGRDRSSQSLRWGPRTIDLDVLFIAGLAVAEERLTAPHPRLREREFALRPLLDVFPGAVDPRDGTRLADCLSAFKLATACPFATSGVLMGM
jgi:2-amino-4-hydroxy-6-hydroxymethyldihydropteridine diphosphokinase